MAANENDKIKESYSRAVAEAWDADPIVTVSEWADMHRILPQKGAAEPGPYRTDRTPYMREIMDNLSSCSPVQEVVFMAGAQIGKALAIDTPIPTPSGWAMMGDIKPGDYVFGDNGKAIRVAAVSPIQHGRECFRVEFSDGSTVVCDGDHLWTVDETRSHGDITKTATLSDLVSAGIKNGNRNRFAVRVAKALDLPPVELPIDPYTLGVWLGDGNSYSNQFTQSLSDAREIAASIEAAGHRVLIRERADGNASCIIDPMYDGRTHCKRGHELAVTGTFSGRKCSECHRQRSMKSQYNKPMDLVVSEWYGFGLRCRNLGLIGNKHIPAAYFRAGIQQRLDLVQGLMDTDGHITEKGRCEFANSNKTLIDGFCELLASLGIKFVVSERHTYTVGGRLVKKDLFLTSYRVSFMVYSETPIFRLARKASKLPTREGRRTSETERRRIVAVHPVLSVPVRCIAVESESRLYLCGRSMIPTHNSEGGNNWIGYVVDHAPGPMLVVQPTVDNAKRYSKQRITPMILESPRLSEKIMDNKSRDSSNTQLEKEFPGGILLLGGANSAAGLRSMPIRYLMADEISNWPGDVDGEGDPLELASARTTTFARRKIYKCSTPGVRGVCRIDAEYQNTDRRRYHIPCPHCGHLHELKWCNFIIPKDDNGKYRPKRAHMACPECGGVIEEHHKSTFLRDEKAGGSARWVATNEEWNDPLKRGYQISALYAPGGWKSWAKIAQQWIDAQGNIQRLQAFINNVLAETWQQKGESVDDHALMERAEEYGPDLLPAEVLVITTGVDVQPDRLEVELIGWGVGEEAWSLEHKVIRGDPNGPVVWQLLDAYLMTEYQHPCGVRLRTARTFVDTGGANTQAVYDYVAAREHLGVYGIKGRGGDGIPPVGTPSKSNIGKIQLVPLGTFALKDTIYGRLRITDPGPGYIHFRRVYDAGYYQQLTAEEVRVKHNTKGFPVREWFKKSESARNEVLDCFAYGLGAFISLGVNLDQLAEIMSGNYNTNDNQRRVRGSLEAA